MLTTRRGHIRKSAQLPFNCLNPNNVRYAIGSETLPRHVTWGVPRRSQRSAESRALQPVTGYPDVPITGRHGQSGPRPSAESGASPGEVRQPGARPRALRETAGAAEDQRRKELRRVAWPLALGSVVLSTPAPFPPLVDIR